MTEHRLKLFQREGKILLTTEVARLEETHYPVTTPIACKWCGGTDIQKYGARERLDAMGEQPLFVVEGQAHLFDIVGLSKKLYKCNLVPDELEKALAWRPLREFLAWAIGTKKKVQLCSVGFVPGVYQVSIWSMNERMQEAKNKAKEFKTGAKWVYSPYDAVFEIVVPEERETELSFAPQEIMAAPARKEEAMQAAMFEKKNVWVIESTDLLKQIAGMGGGVDASSIPGEANDLEYKILEQDRVYATDEKAIRKLLSRVLVAWANNNIHRTVREYLERQLKETSKVPDSIVGRRSRNAIKYLDYLEKQSKDEKRPTLFESVVAKDLSKSQKEEIKAIQVYRERGTRAYSEGDYKTHELYRHITQEELEHYEELLKRARALGGAIKLNEKGRFEVCSGEEIKRLERCILAVKKTGTGNPFAICQSALKCKMSAAGMKEGETVKITGQCEDGKPDKCVFKIRKVGNTLKIIGTKQLGKAVDSPALKEKIPGDVKAALENTVEVVM